MEIERVVLVACGSFNPVTNMHLRMFELARDALHRTGSYRVIAGLLSPVGDAYAKRGLVAATDRCEMIRLAVASSDWLRLDQWESEQPQWTRTLRVLEHVRDVINLLAAEVTNANSSPPTKRRRAVDANENRTGATPPTPTPPSYSGWLAARLISSGQGCQSPIKIKLVCGADVLESFAVKDLWDTNDMEAIVRDFGIVCVTRQKTNPEKFIYDTDLLYRHQRNIHIVTEWITNEISATNIRLALSRGESCRYLTQDAVCDYIYSRGLYGARRPNTEIECTPSRQLAIFENSTDN